MIVDVLKNAHFYNGLGERIRTAFNYLQNTNLASLENGRHDIDGDNVYIIIQDYATKAAGPWEAHRSYLDIQYVIEGREKMGYANTDMLDPTIPYDAEKDCGFFEGDGNFIVVNKGSFVIFAPQDAHIPGLLIEASEAVKKAVVKVKL